MMVRTAQPPATAPPVKLVWSETDTGIHEASLASTGEHVAVVWSSTDPGTSNSFWCGYEAQVTRRLTMFGYSRFFTLEEAMVWVQKRVAYSLQKLGKEA